MDDPGAELIFTEPRVQWQLKCFRRQLQQWEKTVDVSIDPRKPESFIVCMTELTLRKGLVQHQAACVDLYIHEIAVHLDHNVDDFRVDAPTLENRKAPDFITASHVEALSRLLESSHRALDIYLSLDVTCIRSLSNLYIVWNAYAIVILIKLHYIFNSPESKFGSAFVPDVDTDYYLDAMLNKLTEVAAEGKSPCSEAFGFVFMKLKIWHLHRSGQLPDDEQGASPEDQSRHQREWSVLRQEPAQILSSIKGMQYQANAQMSGNNAEVPTSRPYTSATPFLAGGNWANVDKSGWNLNAAYDAASYGNTNWDQFNFSTAELDMFDIYMNNSGWMGYLL